MAANVLEATWLQFSRLTSPQLCRRIVESRCAGLDEAVLEKKAIGVASAVKSVIGYWQTDTSSLNARVLTRYYALLQATIAEQVASGDAGDDLDAVQRHTQAGHGLAAVAEPGSDFPHGYYVVAMKNGHFASYAKSVGLDLSEWSVEKRPTEREWSKCGVQVKAQGLALADILLRIPELQNIGPECLGGRALSFRIGHSARNNKREEAEMVARLSGRASAPKPERVTTYGAIYRLAPDPATGTWLNSLGLPFRDIELTKGTLPEDGEHWSGAVEHPSAEIWWSAFDSYKSDYCGTSIVAPYWGDKTEPFYLHFLALYALSIVVRYLPSLWHRVEHGDLDHVRVLIEHYLAIVDGVGPGLALSRITGKRLIVTTPGSFNAPT